MWDVATYRASGRSRSHAEFTSKISQVAEEADESPYWLTSARSALLAKSTDLARLIDEADQLTAIFTAMGRQRLDGTNANAVLASAQVDPLAAIDFAQGRAAS